MFAAEKQIAGRVRHRERGQSAVLVVVLLAIVGGIAAWLFAARARSEAEAREFARDAATRLAVDLDRKFFDRAIAPDRVAKYPPSYRDRVIDKLRGFGRPIAPVELEGSVSFTSHFFQPTATFRAHLRYPQMPANLYLTISRPRGWWQIDDMNISWEQAAPPEPPPAPAAAAPSPRR
ncbi:MAG TPA: hypothetical protein VK993_05160 [Chthoniobacterales bacterium]|nr:hypothetical protein [Chthoniobacterales bacterium]